MPKTEKLSPFFEALFEEKNAVEFKDVIVLKKFGRLYKTTMKVLLKFDNKNVKCLFMSMRHLNANQMKE